MFQVMKDCLIQTVQKRVGYEASLAHLEFSVSNTDEMVFSLEFKGFSDKLFVFAETVIDIMLECAKEGGFDNQ